MSKESSVNIKLGWQLLLLFLAGAAGLSLIYHGIPWALQESSKYLNLRHKKQLVVKENDVKELIRRELSDKSHEEALNYFKEIISPALWEIIEQRVIEKYKEKVDAATDKIFEQALGLLSAVLNNNSRPSNHLL